MFRPNTGNGGQGSTDRGGHGIPAGVVEQPGQHLHSPGRHRLPTHASATVRSVHKLTRVVSHGRLVYHRLLKLDLSLMSSRRYQEPP